MKLLPRFWSDFWHKPLRAETLAFTRILVVTALLSDQLVQYLPSLAHFFGPEGIAPQGVNDGYLARTWRWPMLFFYSDDMTLVSIVFGVWVAATVGFLVGWRTRTMAFLVWLGAMCFLQRNPNLKNGGDDVMQLCLFLLMISPCGDALSLDARKKRALEPGPRYIRPWSVRLFQIQLCVIYFTTGIAKLKGDTWWEGTSVHYALNDITMGRWSFADFPMPFWVTATLTWATLVFEVGFPLFALIRPTRKWVLLGGILFHVGIWLTIEVGWFSFYSIAMYGAWIPSAWWERRFPKPTAASSGSAGEGTPAEAAAR